MKCMRLPDLVTICLLVVSCSKDDPAGLQKSIRAGDVASVARRLSSGVSANYVLRYGGPPGASASLLHIAVEAGQIEVVKLLLASGADPNIRDSGGRTPLTWVVGFTDANLQTRADILRVLLEASANPNISDAEGKTPLARASAFGKMDMLAQLLQAGADPNLQDKNGNSALHLACSPEVARLLIAAGGAVTNKNISGATPADHHLINGRVDVAAAITNHGARF